IPVTVGIAVSIRITPRIAPERQAKAAYENEIIKVTVVVAMPIAAPTAIPISATRTAIPIAAAPMAALPRAYSAVNGAASCGREMVVAATAERPGCGHRSRQNHGNKAEKERFRIHSNAESSQY